MLLKRRPLLYLQGMLIALFMLNAAYTMSFSQFLSFSHLLHYPYCMSMYIDVFAPDRLYCLTVYFQAMNFHLTFYACVCVCGCVGWESRKHFSPKMYWFYFVILISRIRSFTVPFAHLLSYHQR